MKSKIIHFFLLVVLATVLLLPGTADLPLLDRDEPRFAQATVEMIERGEWVIPYFNDSYRFDKPPLTYWLMRAGYGVFGINELGARFHSMVATLLCSLLLYWAGRRWFSPLAGLIAALSFLLSFQILVNGRSCVADMLLLLFVVTAQMALYELLRPDPARAAIQASLPKEHKRERGWQLILYLSLAFGFLAKGPLALLVPLISLVILRFFLWRKALPLHRLALAKGLLLSLVIVAAWGIPALIMTGGKFWQVGMNEHVVRRGMEVFNGRFHSPAFYLVTALVSLFPWIAFAPQMAGWLCRNSSFTSSYLLAWLLSPYLVFTFYATQLPHYVMPGFPAFYLILGAMLAGNGEKREKGLISRLWYGFILILFATICLLLLAFLLAVPMVSPYTGLRYCILALFLVLFGLLLLLFRHKIYKILAVLLVAAGFALFGSSVRPLFPAVQLQEVFQRLGSSARYMGFNFNEGSLVYYSGGRWQRGHSLQEVQQFLNGETPRLLVALEKEIRLDRYGEYLLGRLGGNEPRELADKDLSAMLNRLQVEGYQLESFEGINTGNSSWVVLRVYYRIDNGQDKELSHGERH